jgi:hypothetical protein
MDIDDRSEFIQSNIPFRSFDIENTPVTRPTMSTIYRAFAEIDNDKYRR